MMRLLPFLVAFICCSFSAVIAQYVGPVERTLRFRVYGADAKPITNKRGERYSVPEDSVLRIAEQRYRLEEINTLHVNDSTWLQKSFPATFHVEDGTKKMIVHSDVTIDSLPFLAGTYYFPRKTETLFEIRSTPDVTIANQAFENFRADPGAPDQSVIIPIIEETQEEIRYSNPERIPAEDLRSIVILLRQVRTTPILTGIVNFTPKFSKVRLSQALIQSSDYGKTFDIITTTADLNLSREAEILNTFFVTENTGWLQIRKDDGRIQMLKTTDGGGTWLPDEVLTSLSPGTMRFYDTLTWYVLTVDRIGRSALYETHDGGNRYLPILDNKPVPTGIAPSTYTRLRVLNKSMLFVSDQTGSRIVKRVGSWWDVQKLTGRLYDVERINDTRAYYSATTSTFNGDSGGVAYVARTVDAGETWDTIFTTQLSQSPFDSYLFLNIKFYDEMTGVIGIEEGILLTRDGGDTWYYLREENYSYCPFIGNFPVTALFVDRNTLVYIVRNVMVHHAIRLP